MRKKWEPEPLLFLCRKSHQFSRNEDSICAVKQRISETSLESSGRSDAVLSRMATLQSGINFRNLNV
jgi:hypothetical protein